MAYEGTPFDVVSLLDTALDVESMGIEALTKYSKDRDPSLIREKPGMRLTKFRVTRAPNSLFTRYVGTAGSDEDRWIRAFQVSVLAIYNLTSQEDGSKLPHIEPSERIHTATGEHRIWGEKELAHVATCYLHEIGRVCWSLGFLPRGSVHSYPLPRTVSDEVELRTAQLVVADAINAARRARDKLLGSEHQTPPSEPDAEATDATATASPTGSPAGRPRRTRKRASKQSSG